MLSMRHGCRYRYQLGDAGYLLGYGTLAARVGYPPLLGYLIDSPPIHLGFPLSIAALRDGVQHRCRRARH